MHSTLFHLGPIAFPLQGLLVAFGLVSGIQLSCSLAFRLGLPSDRIWTLCLIALLTLFLGERLLVVALNLRDFVAHPFWMLGLTALRDDRYFYCAALLSFCAGAGYISAWRLPWRRVADALAPGAGVALAFLSLGSLAAGPAYHAPRGAFTTVAAQANDASALMPALQGSLYTAALHLAFAALAVWLALRATQAGSAAACWLFCAGGTTILLAQLRPRIPGEPLLLNVFTPAQALSIAGLGFAFVLWLSPHPQLRTSPALPGAPGPDL